MSATTKYAHTSWTPADVQTLAPGMTEEQAEEWLGCDRGVVEVRRETAHRSEMTRPLQQSRKPRKRVNRLWLLAIGGYDAPEIFGPYKNRATRIAAARDYKDRCGWDMYDVESPRKPRISPAQLEDDL
jgi:hypothetical protein